MMRLLKVLLLLLLLIIGAAAAFIYTFDVNRYKPELAALVEKQTGRKFAIDGEIRFAPSLLPTLMVQGVKLGNAKWGKAETLLALNQVEAQVALQPLLQRRIEIKRISVTGGTLNLETNAQGEGNWALRPASAAPASRPAIALPALAVELISASQSSVNFRAGDSGKTQALAIEQFTASANADESVKIEFTGTAMQQSLKAQGMVGAWATLAANSKWPVDLSGSLGAAAFTIKGDIDHPLAGPQFALAVSATAASLAELGKLAGLTLPPLAPVTIKAVASNAEKNIVLRDVDVKAGRSDLKGNLTLATGAAPLKVEGNFSSARLDLTEVSPPSEEKGGRVFSADPVFPTSLPSVSANLAVHIAELKTHKQSLTDVKAQIAASGSQLKVQPLSAQMAGGSISGDFAMTPAKAPAVSIKLRGNNIQPSQLPQFKNKKLTGAPTSFNIDIQGAGRSVADVMGSGNGRLLVQMGRGSMPNNLASADLLFDTIRLLNPLSSRSPNTTLECVVLNFGVKGGIATAQNGVAVSTDKLTVLGSGVVNLKTEQLDLAVQPKPRGGSGLNVASLGSGLVRVGGTLSNPKPAASAEGLAGAGARVGAAVATGGLSLLAEGLFNRATEKDDEEVCALALKGAAAKPSKKTTTAEAAPAEKKSAVGKAAEATGNVIKGTGEAVGGALKKLFRR